VNPLLDRVRRALAPDFSVERELASGGMGIVYLGRDITLDRPVAIKIIRPGLATAVAAERFLREARALAAVTHPNIVHIHRAGEADGLAYYVMDYVAAPTLADLLAERPLPPAVARKVAEDLLAALEAVHAHGVVHRDIKPSNVFVGEGGRAILADFGIAKSAGSGEEDLTVPGHPIGTPGYMTPEQMAGGEVGPRSDQCAAAMVLFEAFTGRRWSFDHDTDRTDWTGVPSGIAPALRRALAWRAQDRWPDVASFRAALAGRVRSRRGVSVGFGLSVVAVVVAILLARPGVPGFVPALTVAPFAVRDAGDAPWLGDSIAAGLPGALGASPEIRVVFVPADAREPPMLTGTVTRLGDSIVVEVRVPGGAALPLVRGTVAGWRETADQLALAILDWLWQRDNPYARGLPRDALPSSPRGYGLWTRAEAHYAAGRWLEARAAYQATAAADPCLLCDLRLGDIARWMRQQADSAGVRRYAAARERFTPEYQALIALNVAPWRERFAVAVAIQDRWRQFHLAQFVAGDEIYHRGPLAGLPRSEALGPLLRAVELRPEFAPGWEHLAALAIAEGDSALADSALRRYQPLAQRARDTVSLELLALDVVANAWRFFGRDRAIATTDGVLSDPMVAGARDLAAGPAYLLTYDVPAGVLYVGERFAAGRPRADLVTRGRLAQVHALLALGRPDSALAVARALAARTALPDVRCFVAELPAAVALADDVAIAAAWPALRVDLERCAQGPASGPAHTVRAAWMMALLAAQAGDPVASDRLAAGLGGPVAAPFTRFLSAAALARAGRPADAARRSDTLLQLDSAAAARVPDPFFRALLHLFRARWLTADGRPLEAADELLWQQNGDLVSDYSATLVQATEVDWALGTIARWQRARLLDRGAHRAEACRPYRDVVRLWSEAEPPARLRRDSAQARLAALGCS